MTTDLAIIRDEKPRTTVSYASPPLAQRGSAKVATKFASLFFAHYDPVRDRGTQFIPRYSTGRITTTSRIRQEFAFAAAEVIRQLGDQSGVPDSEALVRASLLEAVIAPNREAFLSVRLLTRNEEVVIRLPVERIS